MTISSAKLLEQLNTFRAKEGQPALKSWKKSRASLEEALKKYRPYLVDKEDKVSDLEFDDSKTNLAKLEKDLATLK